MTHVKKKIHKFRHFDPLFDANLDRNHNLFSKFWAFILLKKYKIVTFVLTHICQFCNAKNEETNKQKAETETETKNKTKNKQTKDPRGGGTDLERGYGDVPRSWPPFFRPPGAP